MKKFWIIALIVLFITVIVFVVINKQEVVTFGEIPTGNHTYSIKVYSDKSFVLWWHNATYADNQKNNKKVAKGKFENIDELRQLIENNIRGNITVGNNNIPKTKFVTGFDTSIALTSEDFTAILQELNLYYETR